LRSLWREARPPEDHLLCDKHSFILETDDFICSIPLNL
jgi:hypothetical protein